MHALSFQGVHLLDYLLVRAGRRARAAAVAVVVGVADRRTRAATVAVVVGVADRRTRAAAIAVVVGVADRRTRAAAVAVVVVILAHRRCPFSPYHSIIVNPDEPDVLASPDTASAVSSIRESIARGLEALNKLRLVSIRDTQQSRL